MRTSNSNILQAIFLIAILVLTVGCKTEKSNKMDSPDTSKDTLSITVLQTADIHGQLDTHPELFWKTKKSYLKTEAASPISRHCLSKNGKKTQVTPSSLTAVTLYRVVVTQRYQRERLCPHLLKIWVMMSSSLATGKWYMVRM